MSEILRLDTLLFMITEQARLAENAGRRDEVTEIYRDGEYGVNPIPTNTAFFYEISPKVSATNGQRVLDLWKERSAAIVSMGLKQDQEIEVAIPQHQTIFQASEPNYPSSPAIVTRSLGVGVPYGH